MEFQLNEMQEMLAQEVYSLGSSFSQEYWRGLDETGNYPWDYVKAFAEKGWLGVVIPEDYGGAGLGVTEAGIILHALCLAGAGTSGASAIHFYMFPPAPVIKYGSEAMKKKYLPMIAAGELLMAFGVTEPNAGLDTSRIETNAVKKGDHWLVNGQKVWTTNGQNAQRILLLARTSPRDPQRPMDGMTLFFTDLDRTACTVRRIEKLGRAAVDSNEVFIQDLEVPDEDVVGEVGKGFRYLLDGLNPERIVIAFEAIGMGRWALRTAAKYANERVVFDRPIGANQGISHPLAREWCELEAAELLAHKAAWLYDNGKPCGKEANAAKYLAGEAGFRACDAAMQAHGGYGYSKEFNVERIWREVRLFRIAPVSQEMCLNFIAERALGLPKSY